MKYHLETTDSGSMDGLVNRLFGRGEAFKWEGPDGRAMEVLARIPRDRIAVLIGKGGHTRKRIEAASGATLEIDSESGDVFATWSEDADPIVRMKMPDVIRAVGRGLAPERAVKLLEDDCFLRMYDIREWVGKQPNQLKRMRGRLIGREGRIRSMVEDLSGCEIAVYGSTVCVIGDADALAIATPAIERILRGAEHGTVIQNLERERRQMRLTSRNLDAIELKGDDDRDRFDTLVPGLAAARERRAERRLKAHQVDPDDEDEVAEMMALAEDESIEWAEE